MPENWLGTLANLCVAFNPKLKPNLFEKHLQNNYPLKSTLIEQLSYIYYRLQGQLDLQLNSLSQDSHAAILCKLTENIENSDACTEGFHNRINDIVASFILTHSLDQVLYCIRKTLVDKTAYELNKDGEIHTWNHIYRVANVDGLGIASNLKEDQYSGALSADLIRECLAKKFQTEFTSFTLPILAARELNQPLSALGYTGSCAEGYTIGRVEAMQKYLEQLFFTSSTSTSSKQTSFLESCEKYFILDRTDEDFPKITDINWKNITLYFAEIFIEKNYLKKK